MRRERGESRIGPPWTADDTRCRLRNGMERTPQAGGRTGGTGSDEERQAAEAGGRGRDEMKQRRADEAPRERDAVEKEARGEAGLHRPEGAGGRGDHGGRRHRGQRGEGEAGDAGRDAEAPEDQGEGREVPGEERERREDRQGVAPGRCPCDREPLGELRRGLPSAGAVGEPRAPALGGASRRAAGRGGGRGRRGGRAPPPSLRGPAHRAGGREAPRPRGRREGEPPCRPP